MRQNHHPGSPSFEPIITIDQRMKGGDGGDKAANVDADGAYDDEDSKMMIIKQMKR